MVVPIEPHVNERVLLVSGHDGLDSTDSSLGRHDLIKRPHVFYLLARSVGHAHQCSRGETTPELALIVERTATRRLCQPLEIVVPDLRDVMGILFRNALVTNARSRAVIKRVTVDICPAEKLIDVRRDRPRRLLSVPLRKHLHNDIGAVATVATIDAAAAAAIVIDAWESPEDPKTSSRVLANIADQLVPTLAAVRSIGMAVIHAPHDRSIHPLVRPLEGETVIDGNIMDSDFIAAALRSAGITRLFYMGYLSNVCILTRSIGIIEMSKRGLDVTLVRDASVAVESAKSMSGEWLHQAAVHLVELNFGTSISAAELQLAVR